MTIWLRVIEKMLLLLDYISVKHIWYLKDRQFWKVRTTSFETEDHESYVGLELAAQLQRTLSFWFSCLHLPNERTPGVHSTE